MAVCIERDSNHVYRADGKFVPGVNKILEWTGLKNYSAIPDDGRAEYAMGKGTAGHAAITLLADENLDWASVDPAIVPGVRGFQSFCSDTGFQVELSAHIVYNPVVGYAGELDFTGSFPDGSKAVLDAKFTDASIQAWVALQCSAYQNALHAPLTYRRFALRLKSDGRYNAVEFPRKDAFRDWATFAGAAGAVNWMLCHGYKLQ